MGHPSQDKNQTDQSPGEKKLFLRGEAGDNPREEQRAGQEQTGKDTETQPVSFKKREVDLHDCGRYFIMVNILEPSQTSYSTVSITEAII